MIDVIKKKFEGDFTNLVKEGEKLLKILQGDNKNLLIFRENYEMWYTEALHVVEKLISNRKKDFMNYYENSKGDSIRKALTFTPPIQEGVSSPYLESLGEVREIPARQIDFARSFFVNQLTILKSISRKFTSSLFDIQTLLQAELLDSSLEQSEYLLKNNFLRPAGVLAGVVLEKHLSDVIKHHALILVKKDPTISELNDCLKNNEVIDVITWRSIQHLGDIRNLCAHNKSREPLRDEVQDLINGVSKIIKNVF